MIPREFVFLLYRFGRKPVSYILTSALHCFPFNILFSSFRYDTYFTCPVYCPPIHVVTSCHFIFIGGWADNLIANRVELFRNYDRITTLTSGKPPSKVFVVQETELSLVLPWCPYTVEEDSETEHLQPCVDPFLEARIPT